MAVTCTIICGSPRSTGVSMQAAEYLRERLDETDPTCVSTMLCVSDMDIAPCIGCDRCRDTDRCFMHDDMDRVMEVLEHTDRLFVVSPIYFAGPPAQFKALLDRLQPHFWQDTRAHLSRPAWLLAVGEGHDPYGYDPLVVCMRSALSVAGFKLLDVADCIGADVHKSVDAAFPDIHEADNR